MKCWYVRRDGQRGKPTSTVDNLLLDNVPVSQQFLTPDEGSEAQDRLLSRLPHQRRVTRSVPAAKLQGMNSIDLIPDEGFGDNIHDPTERLGS